MLFVSVQAPRVHTWPLLHDEHELPFFPQVESVMPAWQMPLESQQPRQLVGPHWVGVTGVQLARLTSSARVAR